MIASDDFPSKGFVQEVQNDDMVEGIFLLSLFNPRQH